MPKGIDGVNFRQYVLRRLALLVPVLLGVTFVTFSLTWFATDGHLENQYLSNLDKLSEEKIDRIIRTHGFDQPFHVQYVHYLRNVVTGEWGYSTSVNMPVKDVLAKRFPASLELGAAAMLFAVVMGIPLGVLSAAKRDEPVDHVTRVMALAGVSMPIFWLALLLQLYLSFHLGEAGFKWFPLQGRYDPILALDHPSLTGGPTGFLLVDTLLARDTVAFADALRHLILPAFTLAFATLAIITRMMRAGMLEVLGQDYVRTARAKGLHEKVVVNRHARANALIPTVTVVGISFGGLINGTVLTETIFAWPGLGGWSTRAIGSSDVAATMTFVVLSALLFVIANLVVDLVYAFLDPRVRLE